VYSRVRRFSVTGLIVLGLIAALSPLSVTARSAPYMSWPTVGRETQGYGCTGFWAEPARFNCDHFHSGIDIANARGTPIRSAASGTITYVGREPWYHGEDKAWVVVINHGNNVVSIYVHLIAQQMPGVHKGAHVDMGDVIGLMGMTGRATGVHLHFGVKVNGVFVDPDKYLPSTSPPLH
jgi:murein DD-endopeptidase MepM/ murein hydrolase activator NlpD